jgi:hypothetical protein
MTDAILAEMATEARNAWLDRQAEAATDAAAEARAEDADNDPDAWQTGQDRYEASFNR